MVRVENDRSKGRSSHALAQMQNRFWYAHRVAKRARRVTVDAMKKCSERAAVPAACRSARHTFRTDFDQIEPAPKKFAARCRFRGSELTASIDSGSTI